MAQIETKSLTLKVAEALAKDVGRVIARLDPQDMTRIGAEVGDIVQITGKRLTVAKVMPAYTQDRGKGTVYHWVNNASDEVTV